MDHQRLAELAGQLDLRGESALLVGTRRCTVAVKIEAALTDRQAALVRRKRTQLRQRGVVETACGGGVAADRRLDLGE